MKKIVIVLVCIAFAVFTQAQEIIKVGSEKTITCSGTFISEVQNYYSNGSKASISKFFMDAKGDSLIFFEAVIDADRESQTVIKRTVAKKDIDKGDWGIETEAIKENGAAFQLLKIKTTEGNSLIKEETHKSDEVEINEDTNRVHIYFAADKEADAKKLGEQIKKTIQ